MGCLDVRVIMGWGGTFFTFMFVGVWGGVGFGTCLVV